MPDLSHIAEQLRSLAIPVADLAQDPANARSHGTKNLEAIKASLRVYGQRKPVVVKRDGMVVEAGNATLTAAKALGWAHLAAVIVDDDALTATGYGLADNRSGSLAEWDDAVLARLLVDLREEDVDLGDLGWDDAEVEALLRSVAPEPPAGEDGGGGELPSDPVSRLGEVYEMGPHKLMCGNSTKRDDVAELLQGERAPLMATDPPFGVAISSTGSEKLTISGDLTQAAIPLSFAVAIELALDDNARVYLCGGTNNFAMYSGLFDHYLRKQPRLIVWDKTHFVLRPNNYHAQFELVYWGWKGSGGAEWFGDRKQVDVWSIPRDPSASYVHPTQKPVEIFARMVRNSAPPDGIVYEPFAGSGSCLIACAQEGRRCRAMELDPRYADVVRARWGTYARSAGIDPGPGAL